MGAPSHWFDLSHQQWPHWGPQSLSKTTDAKARTCEVCFQRIGSFNTNYFDSFPETDVSVKDIHQLCQFIANWFSQVANFNVRSLIIQDFEVFYTSKNFILQKSRSNKRSGRPALCSIAIPLAMSSVSLGEPVRWYSTQKRVFMLVAMKMDRKEEVLICFHKIQHLSKTKRGIWTIHALP